MSRIRILPDQVANQIAAGEVIERPVAVVRELVENSLDAEANRVEIEFRGGGKQLIRVEDNGQGMKEDEALLSLERHATSKIREAADLHRILTFGFRGEALPSIASVSRFTLQTRARGELAGTEILVHGGKLLHKKACGMPEGTRIEVAQLFNSVPARRKFLKTDQTESAHIIHACRLFAVAHQNCAFTLTEGGRTLFQSGPCERLQDRIGEIWGSELAEALIPISARSGEYRLTGLIGKPGYSRSTRNEIITLINRRPVENRTLSFALIEAYHTVLPRGRFPVAFLFLEIDPAAVDVNVHPAKREVRFREESRVRHFVLSSILDQLRQAAEGGRPAGMTPQARPQVAADRGPVPVPPPTQPTPDVPQASVPPAAIPPVPRPEKTESAADPEPAPEGARAINWRFLGRMVHGFALFETGNGLVLLDPDAARSRIRYEQICGHFQAEVPASQALLIPLSLDLDPRDGAAFEENADFLNENGFSVERFGSNFYRVTALPPWLDPGEAETFLRDLIGQVRQRNLNLRMDRPELAHETLARLAANRRGTASESPLSPAALTALAQQLLSCRDPLTDPGGRATFVELSRGELDRRFGR